MNVEDRKLSAHRLTDAKRVIVKVGSALLVDAVFYIRGGRSAK